MVVFHHAMADGVGSAALAAALLDAAPVTTQPPSTWRPAPAPSSWQLRREAVTARLAALSKLVSRTAHRSGGRSDVRETVTAVRTTAPRLQLPVPATAERGIAAMTWPLEDLRAVAHAHGATVNDVLLAATVAGLRALLVERGRSVAGLAVRVSVPVAGRPGSRNAGGTIPMVLTVLADEPDPVRTLHAISAVTARAKAHRRRDYAGLFASPLMPASLVRLAIGWMVRHSAGHVNLYLTNVPGPAQRLWLRGAQLRTGYPIPPIAAGVPLAVGALSYAGTLALTVNGDPRPECPTGQQLTGRRAGNPAAPW